MGREILTEVVICSRLLEKDVEDVRRIETKEEGMSVWGDLTRVVYSKRKWKQSEIVVTSSVNICLHI